MLTRKLLQADLQLTYNTCRQISGEDCYGDQKHRRSDSKNIAGIIVSACTAATSLIEQSEVRTEYRVRTTNGLGYEKSINLQCFLDKVAVQPTVCQGRPSFVSSLGRVILITESAHDCQCSKLMKVSNADYCEIAIIAE